MLIYFELKNNFILKGKKNKNERVRKTLPNDAILKETLFWYLLMMKINTSF